MSWWLLRCSADDDSGFAESSFSREYRSRAEAVRARDQGHGAMRCEVVEVAGSWTPPRVKQAARNRRARCKTATKNLARAQAKHAKECGR
jgi:hypothetical protein